MLKSGYIIAPQQPTDRDLTYEMYHIYILYAGCLKKSPTIIFQMLLCGKCYESIDTFHGVTFGISL
jgi:hypothetical protein